MLPTAGCSAAPAGGAPATCLSASSWLDVTVLVVQRDPAGCRTHAPDVPDDQACIWRWCLPVAAGQKPVATRPSGPLRVGRSRGDDALRRCVKHPATWPQHTPTLLRKSINGDDSCHRAELSPRVALDYTNLLATPMMTAEAQKTTVAET